MAANKGAPQARSLPAHEHQAHTPANDGPEADQINHQDDQQERKHCSHKSKIRGTLFDKPGRHKGEAVQDLFGDPVEHLYCSRRQKNLLWNISASSDLATHEPMKMPP